MYFLDKAANYSFTDVLRHTFAYGNENHLAELRAYLAAHYGATYDHVALYHNGRSALAAALKATTHRGARVIVDGLTCCAVPQAVKAAGCTPVYADIDRDTLQFGRKELEKAFTGESNVQAVIIQNTLGVPCNIQEIEEFCQEHKLTIIEDLAHCTGVKYPDGREVGTVGRAVALSFGKGKSIDTISGGAVIFTNPLDAPAYQPYEKPLPRDRIRDRFYPLFGSIIRGLYRISPKLGKGFTAFLVKAHGIQLSADAKLDTDVRLTCWQAKLALRQLKQLPHRGRPPIREHYFVKNRDELLKELEKIGFVFNDVWYDVPVSPKRYFNKTDFHAEACPVATEVAATIINVPIHYEKAALAPALKLIKKYEIKPEAAEFSEVSHALTKTPEPTPVKVEPKPAAKTEKVSESAHALAKTEKLAATQPARKPRSVQPKPAPKPTTTSMPGMKVNKPKLTEREILKAKLEKGERGKNSVV